MAPEQASGGSTAVDGRSDLYSLGVTLHELITGEPVVAGESREQVLAAVMTSQPKPLRQVAPTAPRDLETILLKCTARDPAARYQHASVLAEDLRRFVAGESIRARRTPLIVRAGRFARKHRTVLGAATLAILLIVAAVLMTVHLRRLKGEGHVRDALNAILLEHDSDRSRDLLVRAKRLGIESADYHLCEGLTALLQGEPQRALEPLEQAREIEPEDVEILLASAHAHMSVGDVLVGHWYFRQVDEADINTPLGWLLHGYCRNDLGTPGATDSFDHALELRSNFTPAIEARAFDRAMRVLVDAEADLMQPMFDDYEAWVTFWPVSPRAHAAHSVGRMYAAGHARRTPALEQQAVEWMAEAGRDLDRAIELAGEPRPGLLVRRGAWLLADYRFEEAAEALAEAIAADRAEAEEEHPAFVHHRAVALHALGRVEEAVRETERSCELYPSFFPQVVHRALLLAEAGDLEGARQTCLDCMHRELPSDGTGFVLAGAVLDLLGGRAELLSQIEASRVPAENPSPAPALRDEMKTALAFLAGEIGAMEMVATAGQHPGLRCELSFVAAMRAYADGDRTQGAAWLKACTDTGVFTYAQYRYTQAIRARIEADPNWPAWIE